MSSNDWLIAVSLAASASFLSNIGVLLQKKCHQLADQKALGSAKNNRQSSITSEEPPAYTSSIVWRAGLLMVIAGSLFDFIALEFGSQSLIAPLASLNLVSNVICAPILLKEKITKIDLISTSLIIIGSVLAIIYGSHENAELTVSQLFGSFARADFILFATVSILLILGLTQIVRRIERDEKERSLFNQNDDNQQTHRIVSPTAIASTFTFDSKIQRDKLCQKMFYPILSGIYGCNSVLFAKCTVILLTNTFRSSSALTTESNQILNLHDDTTKNLNFHENAFTHSQTYLIILMMFFCIFAQIKYLNSGLKRFESVQVVPIFSAIWITGTVVSGLVFYKEYQSMDSKSAFLFTFGVLITVTGILVLSTKKERNNDDVTVTSTSEAYSDDLINVTRALSVSALESQRQSLSHSLTELTRFTHINNFNRNNDDNTNEPNSNISSQIPSPTYSSKRSSGQFSSDDHAIEVGSPASSESNQVNRRNSFQKLVDVVKNKRFSLPKLNSKYEPVNQSDFSPPISHRVQSAQSILISTPPATKQFELNPIKEQSSIYNFNSSSSNGASQFASVFHNNYTKYRLSNSATVSDDERFMRKSSIR